MSGALDTGDVFDLAGILLYPGILYYVSYTCIMVGRCRSTPGTPWFPQSTPRLLSGTFRNFHELSGTFRNFQLLKLKHDELLSSIAFNCNLRLCIMCLILLNFLLGIIIDAFIEVKVGRCKLTPG